MNIRNHTGERPFVLSGDQGEEPLFAHGKTFKFFTKDLPRATGRLANYVLGFLVTLDATFNLQFGEIPSTEGVDWDDVARGCFESCELLNTVLGKPISHNYFRGEFFGLFGFVGNGMKRAIPQPPLLPDNTSTRAQRHSWYIPASALLGMKGHHTAQLAILMDKGTFEVKTAQAGVVDGLTITSGKLSVTAIMVAEPEIRLGPGTQFVRYASTIAPTGTKHQIEALGQTSSLQGVEEGAGIAFLAWMSSRRGYGGSFANAYDVEYLNLPFRGLDQLIHLDAVYADYLGSCGNNDLPPSLTSASDRVTPFDSNGLLYSSLYDGIGRGLLDAGFIPLISPKAFLETSKMQSVQGSQDLHAKLATPATFSGDDVFVALQYHSWTPAQQEVVLRKIIDSGLGMDVWGTNDLVPATKINGKQNALGINPSKTRYFAHTWSPREVQPNPPSQSAKA